MLGGGAYLELTLEALHFTQTSSHLCFLVHSNVNTSSLSLTPTSVMLSSNYGLHPPNCKVNPSDFKCLLSPILVIVVRMAILDLHVKLSMVVIRVGSCLRRI